MNALNYHEIINSQEKYDKFQEEYKKLLKAMYLVDNDGMLKSGMLTYERNIVEQAALLIIKNIYK